LKQSFKEKKGKSGEKRRQFNLLAREGEEPRTPHRTFTYHIEATDTHSFFQLFSNMNNSLEKNPDCKFTTTWPLKESG
jgi:hypothetical protein